MEMLLRAVIPAALVEVGLVPTPMAVLTCVPLSQAHPKRALFTGITARKPTIITKNAREVDRKDETKHTRDRPTQEIGPPNRHGLNWGPTDTVLHAEGHSSLTRMMLV